MSYCTNTLIKLPLRLEQCSPQCTQIYGAVSCSYVYVLQREQTSLRKRTAQSQRFTEWMPTMHLIGKCASHRIVLLKDGTSATIFKLEMTPLKNCSFHVWDSSKGTTKLYLLCSEDAFAKKSKNLLTLPQYMLQYCVSDDICGCRNCLQGSLYNVYASIQADQAYW